MKTSLSYLLATGFYSGRSPLMPGTAGSLAFLLLWLLIETIAPLSLSLWTVLSCVIGLVGVLSTEISTTTHPALRDKGHDPSSIVIDEWCGQSIALLGVSASTEPLLILCAFLLFRLFDITKPLLVSRAERLPGAYGIMADDIVAGLLALAGVQLIRYLT